MCLTPSCTKSRNSRCERCMEQDEKKQSSIKKKKKVASWIQERKGIWWEDPASVIAWRGGVVISLSTFYHLFHHKSIEWSKEGCFQTMSPLKDRGARISRVQEIIGKSLENSYQGVLNKSQPLQELPSGKFLEAGSIARSSYHTSDVLLLFPGQFMPILRATMISGVFWAWFYLTSPVQQQC